MKLTQKYGYQPSEDEVNAVIQSIAANLEGADSTDVLKKCFSTMDLTTLRPNDTVEYVRKFVDKVNRLETEYPEYPAPASICVFPNFAPVVAAAKKSPEVHVTAVAGCFPNSQSFIEVKQLECEMAVENGADEIDIVLALNSFLAGDNETAANEIVAMKKAIDAKAAAIGKTVVLKVILETGVLVSPELIAEASFLAMEAGADFIKTSTGKVDVNATPMAAVVMCESIKRFHEKTGKMVGFKAAGGVSTAKEAVAYYQIVSTILGPEWLDKKYFRLGVSRLGNNLMSAIEQKTIKYF